LGQVKLPPVGDEQEQQAGKVLGKPLFYVRDEGSELFEHRNKVPLIPELIKKIFPHHSIQSDSTQIPIDAGAGELEFRRFRAAEHLRSFHRGFEGVSKKRVEGNCVCAGFRETDWKNFVPRASRVAVTDQCVLGGFRFQEILVQVLTRIVQVRLETQHPVFLRRPKRRAGCEEGDKCDAEEYMSGSFSTRICPLGSNRQRCLPLPARARGSANPNRP
jgi:hypothetical protein